VEISKVWCFFSSQIKTDKNIRDTTKIFVVYEKQFNNFFVLIVKQISRLVQDLERIRKGFVISIYKF